MDSLTEYTEYNASMSKLFKSDGAFSHKVLHLNTVSIRVNRTKLLKFMSAIF